MLSPEEDEILELKGRLMAAEMQRDNLAMQLAQIRGVMGEVSVYEGLVDASPVVMMVSELARDHEELEARIDAVLMLIGPDSQGDLARVVEILRGGTRFSDEPDLGSG